MIKVPANIHGRLVFLIGWSLSMILMLLTMIVLRISKESILRTHTSQASATIQAVSQAVSLDLYLIGDNQPEVDDYLSKFISGFIHDAGESTLYMLVVDDDHTIRAHSDIQQYGGKIQDVYTTAAIQSDEPLMHIYEHPTHGWVIEVTSQLGNISPIHGAMRLGIDAQVLRQSLKTMTLTVLFIFGSALLVVLYLVSWISRSVTRKLRRTAEFIESYDPLATSPVILPESDDEIGLVNKQFTKLQERLISSRFDLEATNRNLMHTEKLAALGRMAAGVAHAINNPLLGLKNCVQLLRMDDDREANLQLLSEGIDRIEGTVSSLLGTSRKRVTENDDFQVNECARNVVSLIGHRFSKQKVVLTLDLEENLPMVTGDRLGFEEILLNLSMNALDAIHGPGTIRITTDLNKDTMSVHVDDSGPGVKKKLVEKVFEPFYTTKEVGQGTGLGLYVSREIITSMGGDIYYSVSSLGGARFSLVLPVLKDENFITLKAASN